MPRILLSFSLVVLLAQIDCTNTKKSTDSVCDSWAANDKAALDRAVDRFTRSLDPKRSMNENAKAIADWLEKQPCIKQASLPSRTVETLPPAMDITVRHRNDSTRTFSIQFDPKKVSLSYSY